MERKKHGMQGSGKWAASRVRPRPPPEVVRSWALLHPGATKVDPVDAMIVQHLAQDHA